MYQSTIRAKKNKNKNKSNKTKTLTEPEDGQEYAVVKDMLGNGRLRAFCADGTEKVGRIRGSMRKYAGRVIINKGDLVLISGRDFGNDDKVDVFYKYSLEEVHALIKQKLLPEKIYKALSYQDESTFGKSSAADDYVMFMETDSEETGDDSAKSEPGDEEMHSESSEDIDIDAI